MTGTRPSFNLTTLTESRKDNITMASEKKKKATETSPRVKKDGTPWAPPIKRPASEILAEAVKKRARIASEAAERLAACDETIGKYIAQVSPRDAVAAGLTLAQITEAHAVLREKAERELAALMAEAEIGRAHV